MLSLWQDAVRGVGVVQLETKEEVEPLTLLFEGVAQREGWQPDGALRSWQGRRVSFALETRGRVDGGLQLVLPDAAGSLPCQALWPEAFPAPPRRAAHVAVLALDEAVRGQGLLFWRLAVEMWRYCVGAGIVTLYIEVTPRVLPIYQRLGWPLKIRGDLRRHWGEDCYLCSLGIPEVARIILERAEHSAYYREIVAQAFRVALPEHVGLEASRAVLMPPAEALC